MEAREKLANYIKENGLLKSFVAEKVGSTANNFSLWMKGKSKPTKASQMLIEQFTSGAVKASDWE